VDESGRQAKIIATMDGKEVVNWKGAVEQLSFNSNLKAPRRLGVGLSNAVIRFDQIQLKVLEGEARWSVE